MAKCCKDRFTVIFRAWALPFIALTIPSVEMTWKVF